MILVYGEILFDVFPDEKRLGGAPFNFAYHLKKLGLPVRFFSRVGRDAAGREILEFLTSNGFDPSDIQVDRRRPTGSVQVKMTGQGHAFTIMPDTAWTNIQFDSTIRDAVQAGCDIFYFGSMTQHNSTGRDLLRQILKQIPRPTKIFCDINLRPQFYNTEKIRSWISCIDILKLNEDELEVFLPPTKENLSGEDKIRSFMQHHNIESLLLTLGEKGSLWADQTQIIRTSVHPSSSPVADTVGAGDAFAAMFTAGISCDLSARKAMEAAADFAAFICTIKGALPNDNSIYSEFSKRISCP